MHAMRWRAGAMLAAARPQGRLASASARQMLQVTEAHASRRYLTRTARASHFARAGNSNEIHPRRPRALASSFFSFWFLVNLKG
jgi:hypothetical protein